MADIIKVEHLSYVYNPGMPNAVTALDDVSFTVEEATSSISQVLEQPEVESKESHFRM